MKCTALSGTNQLPPFFQTVEFTDQSSRVKPFCAEVNTGSFCTMISCDYLASHLLSEPVDPVSEPPCTYNHRPILAIQGMVKLKASIADCAVEVVVYMVGNPCKSLIGQDLLDGLGLSIQGRGYTTGLGPTGPMGPQLPLLGPHPTSVLHGAVQYLSPESHSGYPKDAVSVPGVVMRVQPGKALSRSALVPGPCIKHSVHMARTRLGDEVKNCTPLTVDTKRHIHTNMKCSRSQWRSSVKLLFHVSSFVLLRHSHRNTG